LDIKETTRLWELALLDGAARGLTFAPDRISFDGYHCGGYRLLEEPLLQGGSSPVVVPGRVFTSLLDLFGEPELILKNKTLYVRAKGREATIPTAAPPLPIVRNFEPQERFSIVAKDLIQALQTAAPFGAVAMVAPVLTGAHLRATKSHLFVETTSGQGRASLIRLPATDSSGGLNVVVPIADLMIALSCLDAEVAYILWDGGGTLCVSDDITVIYISLLLGNYPDLSKLPRRFNYSVVLPPALLALAARAADALHRDKIIAVTLSGGEAQFMTEDEELGKFTVDLGVEAPDIDITLRFESPHLTMAAQLGDAPVLRFNDDRSLALLTGDADRYLWLSPIRH
jgi:hypothetical protein